MQEQPAVEPDLTDQAPMTPDQMMQAASDRILALEAELAEMKERWIRAEAENANVRARARKDVDETRQYAVQKFATDVVEAAENLKRGIDSLPPVSADEPAILGKVREELVQSVGQALGVKPAGSRDEAIIPVFRQGRQMLVADDLADADDGEFDRGHGASLDC